MRNALIAGMAKTGTTIVASVIQQSLAGSRLYVEPTRVAFFEKPRAFVAPLVVKILYEHWMNRKLLLTGILRGETEFRAERTVVIVRDPRDTLISAFMYMAYERVMAGAGRSEIGEWVDVLRAKESDPWRYSVINLIEEFGRIFDCPQDPNSTFELFVDYSGWIHSNRDYAYLLRYEDFVAGETEALGAYLGIDLSRSREVDPGLQRVARTRGSGAWRRMMLPADVTLWKERYGAALSSHAYEDWQIEPATCDPKEGSAYVLKIAQEAFALRAGSAAA